MSTLELKIHQEECEGLSSSACGVVCSLAALDAGDVQKAAAYGGRWLECRQRGVEFVNKPGI